MDNLTQQNDCMDSKEITQYIGKVIREKRMYLKLTIEDLSEILNIAPGFLGLIERGQRGTSLINLFRITSFFDISIDEL